MQKLAVLTNDATKSTFAVLLHLCRAVRVVGAGSAATCNATANRMASAMFIPSDEHKAAVWTIGNPGGKSLTRHSRAVHFVARSLGEGWR